MKPKNRRGSRTFRPEPEVCEGRLLLSGVNALSHPRVPLNAHPLFMFGFTHPIRPNTPVLPFAATSDVATFIDPSVRVFDGRRITIGPQSYLAPYGTLDARSGLMKIGRLTTIQDNASLIANPNQQPGTPGIIIGDTVVIGFGATIRGPSVIGGYDQDAAATYVGPNAVIDGANLAPGAYVSALAYVGPGVTVPAGIKVLPGAAVTTQAEATNPALGKVAGVTSSDVASVQTLIQEGVLLASGYSSLYQGNKATGASSGTTNANIFNGDLSQVLGVSPEPGKTFVSFEPAQTAPKFPSPRGLLVPSSLPSFRARVIGGVVFGQRAADVAHSLGHSDSIRGDVGQPITIGSIASLGDFVTIHAPKGGKLTIGQNFNAEAHSVILGGSKATIGDNVVVGLGAVLDNATVGSGSTIGAGSYLRNVTIPAGMVIPPGTFLIGPAS